MSGRKAFFINANDCSGCLACEVACKQEHDLPVGPGWIKVSTNASKNTGSKLQRMYKVTQCMHCSEPQCAEACPTNAIIKRADGVVLVDVNLCNGCSSCVDACPLGAMQFDSEQGIGQKCDMCVTRIDRGLKPFCVNACPAHCIIFGEKTEVESRIRDADLLTEFKRWVR